MLTTLMRLVFLLYAEDRNLMAQDPKNPMDSAEVYQRFYGLIGLHEKLREDAAAYPATMDQRFGAWAQFLTLSRLIHDGGGHGHWRLPAGRGRLFDPDACPFLEGRPYTSTAVLTHLETVGCILARLESPNGNLFTGAMLFRFLCAVQQAGPPRGHLLGLCERHVGGPAYGRRV